MALEIEKKFVLKRLPLVAWDNTLTIRQHYGINEKVPFRIRLQHNTETGEDIKYIYNTKVYVSSGINEEFEKEISKEEYTDLLVNNVDRGLLKIRYILNYDGLKWEVDDYLNCNLIMAEIELPSMNFNYKTPKEIQDLIIDEVTGLTGFSNSNLAENMD